VELTSWFLPEYSKIWILRKNT